MASIGDGLPTFDDCVGLGAVGMLHLSDFLAYGFGQFCRNFGIMLDGCAYVWQQQHAGRASFTELRVGLLLLGLQFVEIGVLLLAGFDIRIQTVRGLVVVADGCEIHYAKHVPQ